MAKAPYGEPTLHSAVVEAKEISPRPRFPSKNPTVEVEGSQLNKYADGIYFDDDYWYSFFQWEFEVVK